MAHDHDETHPWVKHLPQSHMVYPEAMSHRIRYFFWRLYSPYHAHVRDGVIALRVIKNYGRQPYLLGQIAPEVSMEDFVAHLVDQGYAYHRVAWEDDGEVVSLRHVSDFIFQYHIRIFQDREVRAHYEYTPECYPLAHLLNANLEARREEFLALMGDRIVPSDTDEHDFRWEVLPLLQRIWK